MTHYKPFFFFSTLKFPAKKAPLGEKKFFYA